MKLYRASGIKTTPQVTDESRKLLLATAILFYRAGGTVTLDDWSTLTEDEQDAMVSANRSVEIERACWVGLASQGTDKVAKVLSEIDGGDAMAQLLTDVAANHAKGAMNGCEVEQ